MLLEERRSVIRHIILNIFTLGIYGLFATADIARDTNVACHGDGKKSVFGGREMLFSILTLGIYQVYFMYRIILRWNSFVSDNGRKSFKVNEGVYIVCRLSVVASFAALSLCFRRLGELCQDFNDSFFRTAQSDGAAERARRAVEETVAKRREQESKIAGIDVISEYDFERDRLRVDHSAEYAARAALLAELEEEGRREAEEKLAREAEEARQAEKEKQLLAEKAHRNKKWFRVVFAGIFAVFMLPFIFVLAITLSPSVYEETFVGELSEKYALLNSIDEKKVVVIGGSSVAFGLDSEMMEEHLDMKVVNFGLYADLGTKIMMDLSKSNINKGDIIVIAPELNAQTLSLYFNADTALQAIDGNWLMVKNIGTDNYEALIGASWRFAGEKLEYLISGDRPGANIEGAYRKDCFNKYGDNTFDRPYNTMKNIEKSIKLDFRTKYDDGVTSDYERFIAYVNEYTAYCNFKGATVYFSFAPMCDTAMDDYNTAENIYNFYRNLCSSLDCRVISDINRYIMDEGYFYDSEFHLNNAGVTVRTVQLIDDIKREQGINTLTVSRNDLPEPPGFAPMDTVEGDQENLYFQLESSELNGAPIWYVVGLNEAGMAQDILRVPNNVDGVPVIGIKANAFAGSLVKTLYLGENIGAIGSRAFSGATQLTAVYIPYSITNPDDITIPNSENLGGLATEGASDALKIYVNQNALKAFYDSVYFWGDYSSRLVGYELEE